MSITPLHPALVHLPIGISLVLPLLGLAAFFAIRRGALPKRAWLAIVSLQAVVLATGILSARTGEDDRRQTVMTIGSARVDPHQEAGERFNIAAGVSFALGAACLFPGPAALMTVGRIAASLSSVVTAGLAASAGHSGGELVYRYGAAAAFLPEEPRK